jgi:hypothetical protein
MPYRDMHVYFPYLIEINYNLNLEILLYAIWINKTDPAAYIFYPIYRFEYNMSVKFILSAWSMQSEANDGYFYFDLKGIYCGQTFTGK